MVELNEIRESIIAFATQEYKAGYKKGWEDAWARVIQLMKQYVDTKEMPPDTALVPPVEAAAAARRAAGVPDIVLGLIRRQPGMNGVEVVGQAALEGNPIKERSVRTALRRLRIKGMIFQDSNGRWFASATAPAVVEDQGSGEPWSDDE